MPFKFDANGNIVTQEVNGVKLPVLIHADGKEVPFDGDHAVGKIASLNAEAKTHREAKEAAETKLKTFDGIADPAAALKALNTVKNLDEKNLIAAGERDKAVAEAVKSVEEKYAPVVAKNGELESQLNGHLIGSAFSGSKYIADKFAAPGPAGVEIARSLFERAFKVKDGKLVAYGADGKELYSKTRHGEFANAEEAIEQLVDAYPHKDHILKGTGGSGGGSQGSPGGGGGNSKGNLGGSASERTSAIAARFPELST